MLDSSQSNYGYNLVPFIVIIYCHRALIEADRLITGKSSMNMPKRLITVLIVDDHPIIRDGLRAMLECERDIRIIGEAGLGAEAIQLIEAHQPSVAVIDLLLPDMDGIEVIRHTRGHQSSTKCLVLTAIVGDVPIHEAFEAGALGYLFKDMVRSDLCQAIRALDAGVRYVPAPVREQLAEGLFRPAITSRERQILQSMASGRSNRAIATKLNVSMITVHRCIQQILSKLNAKDRTHAVTIATLRGILRSRIFRAQDLGAP